MRRRLLTVLLFAITSALIASTAAYRVINARTAGPPAAKQLVPVAARDLATGALVQAGDVEYVDWTGSADSKLILHKEDVLDRGVVAFINKGEPFAENRLAPKGAGAGLAVIIPPGMRAVAVRVDDVVGVSGFVLPGMRVDVVCSGTPVGQSGTVTRTILQNIQVLSAGQNLERDAQGKPASVQVVNLLVSPGQAEMLSLASGQMKVQLVLRNPLDTDLVKTDGISAEALLTRAEAPKLLPRRAPAVSRPAPPVEKAPTEMVSAPVTMEVISGGKRESVVVGHTVEERSNTARR